VRSGRRGSTPHHGVGGERRPRTHEAEVFAQKIAGELERGWRSHEFDRLVIMAPPAFLGLLRKALPQSLRTLVAAEVVKDLVHQPPEVLQAHLPGEAFREALHS
jgi:protein required for attachment to host cells